MSQKRVSRIQRRTAEFVLTTWLSGFDSERTMMVNELLRRYPYGLTHQERDQLRDWLERLRELIEELREFTHELRKDTW